MQEKNDINEAESQSLFNVVLKIFCDTLSRIILSMWAIFFILYIFSILSPSDGLFGFLSSIVYNNC